MSVIGQERIGAAGVEQGLMPQPDGDLPREITQSAARQGMFPQKGKARAQDPAPYVATHVGVAEKAPPFTPRIEIGEVEREQYGNQNSE